MTGDPFGLKFVRPDPHRIIILDRVVEGTVPEYCVHGRTMCMRCRNWCWLGDETKKLVSAGDASPLCMQCAAEVVPPQHVAPIARVADHRRIDGPHG
jgi:hypothetical protein